MENTNSDFLKVCRVDYIAETLRSCGIGVNSIVDIVINGEFAVIFYNEEELPSF